MSPILAAGFFGLGGMEFVVLIILGVLLFGRKLPEVGRSLGKGIVEFKKGLKGLEDEVEGSSLSSPSARTPEPQIEQPRPPQRVAATAPKFEDDAGTVSNPPKA